MAEKATMVFTTRSGASLALEPHSGKSGAVGIFMPREGIDQFFPLPKYAEQYAESPDTEGGRRLLSKAENATGSGTVVIAGDDQASFRSWHQTWQSFVEEMRAGGGGSLTYTPSGGTSVTYEIESMKITGAKYDGVLMLAFVQEFEFEFTCHPYGLLSNEEQTLRDHDPFSRETMTSGEWAFDLGAGTMTVTPYPNSILSLTTSTGKRLYRSGVKSSNSTATFRVNTGSEFSGEISTMMRRTTSSTYLEGYVLFSGVSSRLRVYRRIAGIQTLVAESAAFTTANKTSYWIRTSAIGNEVTVELFTADPDLGATALKSLTATLTGEGETTLGTGVWGSSGMSIGVPGSGTDWTFQEWRWDSKTFRVTSPIADFELPSVKGHVDALGELTVTDLSNQARRFVDYGLEGEYTATVAPPIIIDSKQLLLAGFVGELAERTGAYNPAGGANNTIKAILGPAPSVICSTGPQRYVGKYRSKNRVQVVGSGPAYVRFATSEHGSGQFMRGDWVQVPVVGSWCEVDLGVVESQLTALGEQGWEVRLEALSETPEDTIYVDYMALVGASRYGKSKIVTKFETPTNLTVFDQFNQAAGELNNKQAGVGALLAAGASGSTVAVNEAGPNPDWENPTNANGNVNGTYAQSTVSFSSSEVKSTDYLYLSKYGFAIPEGSTIRGIKMEVTRYAPGVGLVSDENIRLNKGTGKNVGVWPSSPATQVYGGQEDLWGTTWTAAEINSESFGSKIKATITSGSSMNVYVDACKLTVYYFPPGGSAWTETASAFPKFNVVAGSSKFVERGAPTDTANTGRKVSAGSEVTDSVVQADVLNTGGKSGVMLRYKSGTEARLVLALSGGTNPYKIQLLKYTSNATPTVLSKPELWSTSKVFGQWVTLRLEADSDGRWAAWADGLLLGQGYDSALSTGSLASGKVGLYDEANVGARLARWDNFQAWVPEAAKIVWPGRAFRFRGFDALTENLYGTQWNSATGYEGARLRVPPAGPANKTTRLSTHMRRMNVDENVDEWVGDEMAVSLKVTPRVVLLG